jgi:hypothetical protein
MTDILLINFHIWSGLIFTAGLICMSQMRNWGSTEFGNCLRSSAAKTESEPCYDDVQGYSSFWGAFCYQENGFGEILKGASLSLKGDVNKLEGVCDKGHTALWFSANRLLIISIPVDFAGIISRFSVKVSYTVFYKLNFRWFLICILLPTNTISSFHLSIIDTWHHSWNFMMSMLSFFKKI